MRSSKVSAMAEVARKANARAAMVFFMTGPGDFRHCKERSDEAIQSLEVWIASPRSQRGCAAALMRRHLLLAVGDAVHRAVPVVGDQQRTILHLHYLDRPPALRVVFKKPG